MDHTSGDPLRNHSLSLENPCQTHPITTFVNITYCLMMLHDILVISHLTPTPIMLLHTGPFVFLLFGRSQGQVYGEP